MNRWILFSSPIKTAWPPSLLYSAGIVIILHFALLGWLYYSFETQRIYKKPHARLIVKTLDIQPSKPKTETQQEAAVQIKNKVVPKTDTQREVPVQTKNKVEPKAKNSPPKAPPKQKTSPKPSAKVPKESPSKPNGPKEPKKDKKYTFQKDLLAKATESISKIQTPSISNLPTLKAPDAFQTVEMADMQTPADSSLLSYQEELSHQLKLMLKLPEVGRVVLDLTVGRSGNVIKISFVEARSQVNKKYLEKALPSLQLPPFGIYFKGSAEKTFRLELRSDF